MKRVDKLFRNALRHARRPTVFFDRDMVAAPYWDKEERCRIIEVLRHEINGWNAIGIIYIGEIADMALYVEPAPWRKRWNNTTVSRRQHLPAVSKIKDALTLIITQRTLEEA